MYGIWVNFCRFRTNAGSWIERKEEEEEEEEEEEDIPAIPITLPRWKVLTEKISRPDIDIRFSIFPFAAEIWELEEVRRADIFIRARVRKGGGGLGRNDIFCGIFFSY